MVVRRMRHKKVCEKVASNVASIEPQTLPPTSAAMKYHSYRVYYQICVWKEWDSEMQPESWGWRIERWGKGHPETVDPVT